MKSTTQRSTDDLNASVTGRTAGATGTPSGASATSGKRQPSAPARPDTSSKPIPSSCSTPLLAGKAVEGVQPQDSQLLSTALHMRETFHTSSPDCSPSLACHAPSASRTQTPLTTPLACPASDCPAPVTAPGHSDERASNVSVVVLGCIEPAGDAVGKAKRRCIRQTAVDEVRERKTEQVMQARAEGGECTIDARSCKVDGPDVMTLTRESFALKKVTVELPAVMPEYHKIMFLETMASVGRPARMPLASKIDYCSRDDAGSASFSQSLFLSSLLPQELASTLFAPRAVSSSLSSSLCLRVDADVPTSLDSSSRSTPHDGIAGSAAALTTLPVSTVCETGVTVNHPAVGVIEIVDIDLERSVDMRMRGRISQGIRDFYNRLQAHWALARCLPHRSTMSCHIPKHFPSDPLLSILLSGQLIWQEGLSRPRRTRVPTDLSMSQLPCAHRGGEDEDEIMAIRLVVPRHEAGAIGNPTSPPPDIAMDHVENTQVQQTAVDTVPSSSFGSLLFSLPILLHWYSHMPQNDVRLSPSDSPSDNAQPATNTTGLSSRCVPPRNYGSSLQAAAMVTTNGWKAEASQNLFLRGLLLWNQFADSWATQISEQTEDEEFHSDEFQRPFPKHFDFDHIQSTATSGPLVEPANYCHCEQWWLPSTAAGSCLFRSAVPCYDQPGGEKLPEHRQVDHELRGRVLPFSRPTKESSLKEPFGLGTFAKQIHDLRERVARLNQLLETIESDSALNVHRAPSAACSSPMNVECMRALEDVLALFRLAQGWESVAHWIEKFGYGSAVDIVPLEEAKREIDWMALSLATIAQVLVWRSGGIENVT
eukprot:GHVS01025205.1.p1 GENE.GHVS01025205.1~~GHVS01025205.1.p1  ORF type:complete len:945 (+),score=85.96 GHVS01025205.1:368-2836(+)